MEAKQKQHDDYCENHGRFLLRIAYSISNWVSNPKSISGALFAIIDFKYIGHLPCRQARIIVFANRYHDREMARYHLTEGFVFCDVFRCGALTGASWGGEALPQAARTPCACPRLCMVVRSAHWLLPQPSLLRGSAGGKMRMSHRR